MNSKTDIYRFDPKEKKILIIGLGRSGIAASQVLCHLGARVWVQDNKIADQIDGQLLSFFKNSGVGMYLGVEPPLDEIYDFIVVSPGVDPNLPWISRLKDNGCEVIGELELAYRMSNAHFVAITGTNGKTTTTTLTGEIFRKAGMKTHVVGNIGTAVIAEATDASGDDWMITEASSFQLETTVAFKPHVAALLNLTPDHLNRHKTMEAYGKAKSRAFQNQTEDDFAVVNAEDEICVKLAREYSGKLVLFSSRHAEGVNCFVEKEWIKIRNLSGEIIDVMPVEEIRLVGTHNLENVLASIAIAYFSGIDISDIRSAVEAFKGVEHRMEPVGVIDGVHYYNDSKGTNTDATITALRALSGNIILIAGGDAKGQDFSSLAREFKDKVKALVLLGRDREYIAKAAKDKGFDKIYEEKTMKDCVFKAASLARDGDNVLLSPACASWDMYDNFEQRGNDFKSWVDAMQK